MESKHRLIRAAREAFSREGYANASMDRLSAEVGLTRGALYHQFGGKEGLLEAVVDQIDTEIANRITQSLAGIDDDWARFRLGAHHFLRMTLEPEVQRIMLRDAPAVLGDRSERGTHRTCLADMARMLNRLMEQGVIVATDPDALAHLLGGGLRDAALWIAKAPDAEATLERALTAFDRLLEGLQSRQTAPALAGPCQASF